MIENDLCPFLLPEDHEGDTLTPDPCVVCGSCNTGIDYDFSFQTGQDSVGMPFHCNDCGALWGGWEDGRVFVPDTWPPEHIEYEATRLDDE